MAFSLSVANARTELTYIAAIDGKSGANGRHSSTRLDAVLNRVYRMLQSRAYQLGLPHGLSESTGTLGSPVSGEDYISLTIPDAAAEIVGLDVKTGATFEKLDPLVWEQRRDVFLHGQHRVYHLGVQPEHGVGFWAIRKGASVSDATLTQGALAVWPKSLTGKSYALYYASQAGELSDTDVFLLHDGWDEWLLNRAAMVVCQRDSNKRTNYDTAREAWLAADALLESQAARVNRAGKISPTPYGGICL